MRESLQGIFFGVCRACKRSEWSIFRVCGEGKGSERAIFPCLHGLQEHGKGAFLVFAGLERGRNGAFFGFARAASEEKGVFFAVARCANLLRGAFFTLCTVCKLLARGIFHRFTGCKLLARVLFHSLHGVQTPSEGDFFKGGGSCNSESRKKSDFSLFLPLQERVEILVLFFRMRMFYLRCLWRCECCYWGCLRCIAFFFLRSLLNLRLLIHGRVLTGRNLPERATLLSLITLKCFGGTGRLPILLGRKGLFLWRESWRERYSRVRSWVNVTFLGRSLAWNCGRLFLKMRSLSVKMKQFIWDWLLDELFILLFLWRKGILLLIFEVMIFVRLPIMRRNISFLSLTTD